MKEAIGVDKCRLVPRERTSTLLLLLLQLLNYGKLSPIADCSTLCLRSKQVAAGGAAEAETAGVSISKKQQKNLAGVGGNISESAKERQRQKDRPRFGRLLIRSIKSQLNH